MFIGIIYLFAQTLYEEQFKCKPAGSQAPDHRHHQQEGCFAGDGDAGRFQHHHPHPQHLHWGAAGGRARGTGDHRSPHNSFSEAD